jgi:hypothetical protein
MVIFARWWSARRVAKCLASLLTDPTLIACLCLWLALARDDGLFAAVFAVEGRPCALLPACRVAGERDAVAIPLSASPCHLRHHGR